MSIRGANPRITNLVLVDHTQEYNYTFNQDTKKFLVQARNFKDIVFSFNKTGTLDNFISLYSGSPYYEDYVIGPFTIYLKGSEDNIVVEMIEWQAKD